MITKLLENVLLGAFTALILYVTWWSLLYQRLP